MKRDLKRRINDGIMGLIASLCLLVLISFIGNRSLAELMILIRITAAVIFLFALYRLYVWLNKEG